MTRFRHDLLKRSWVNLCVLLTCLALWLCREFVDLQQLEYQRQHLLTQPWRLLTGHLLHFTWTHASYNLVGLLLLCIAFSPEQDPRFDACYWLVGALLLSIFMYYFTPNIQVYRGLSGLLYGYAIYLALIGWSSTPFVSSVLIAAIVGRVIFHGIHAPTGSLDSLGAEIAVGSHIGGLVTGFLCASWRIWIGDLKSR